MAPRPRAQVRNRRKTRGGKDGSSYSEFEWRGWRLDGTRHEGLLKEEQAGGGLKRKGTVWTAAMDAA